MKSKLSKAVCYLSGSMEYCPNGGTSWRNELKKQCWSNGIDITFLDPTNKPKGLTGEGDGKYNNIRKAKDWHTLKEFVHQIRRDDLRCVDLCDFVIVLIDRNIHACGTYDEVFTAEDQHKPILCISVGGKENLPGWMFDVVEIEEIFDNVEQCVEYLRDIHTGVKVMDNRWVLIRDYLTDKGYTDVTKE